MIGHFNSYIQIYWRTPTKRAYTELGLSLGLVIFFWLFAIGPTLSTASGLVRTNREARGTVVQLKQKAMHLSQAKSVYQQEQSKFSWIDTALPQKPEALTFLNQISFLARSHNLNVAGTTLSGSKKGSSASGTSEKFSPLPESYQSEEASYALETLVFEIQAAGNFSDLRSFVQAVETFPRLIEIQTVEFKRPKEASDKLLLKLSGVIFIDPAVSITPEPSGV